MSSPLLSTRARIATTLLSSYKVLALLQDKPFLEPVKRDALREAVYLAYQPWSAREPDHVFEHSWQLLEQHPGCMGRDGLTVGALRALAEEFLVFLHGRPHVALDRFGPWQQSILSRISGLAVQAAARAFPPDGSFVRAAPVSRCERDEEKVFSPLLTPYDPLVEDYLQREGLHETHLHLNGSTHAESCWLRALRAPNTETEKFNELWAQNKSEAGKTRELALAVNPDLNPAELCRQLRAARRLREWLIAAASGALGDSVKLPRSYEQLLVECDDAPPPPEPKDRSLELGPGSHIGDELRWQTMLLEYLEKRPSTALENMLHCYLLLQNQYYRLLVQSEEQFGFDQFQKLTFTTLREPAEKEYFERFRAMHGAHIAYSQVGYLEGRFAPKGTADENRGLIGSILGGYWRYMDEEAAARKAGLSTVLDGLDKHFRAKPTHDRRHMRLALVAHFIKERWKSTGPDAGPYRFYSLRTKLKDKAAALLHTLADSPRLRTWVRGIDAASNELHAPPEVFAATYRVCRQAGLTRRSYHVGEDFSHLLGGLRQMLDALELLDLRDGDRLGHGTAMGILPKLWLARMPRQLVVTRGEWMLDLLAAWRLLRRLPDATAEAYRVECDLADCASQIFGKDVSCAALERAMRFRSLDVDYLEKAQDAAWSPCLEPLNDSWRGEALRVEEARKNNKADTELLWTWLSDSDLWKRSEALQMVDAGYFDAATYLKLQQELMREVTKRGVLIETLPSSNVRISQYHSFNEHHSLRWMGVPGYAQAGDPPIMVTLGSDDPGIFAGDLCSEFYQLYAVLRGEGLSDKEALQCLAPLNERGREYRFHDLAIG